jgi:hypothetical protein
MSDQAPMTPEEKAAADGARDIAANVTDGRNWKEYDEKYVRTRILRAIREVAGKAGAVTVAAAMLCPAQARDYELNGATVHRSFIAGQQCYRVGIDPNGFDWPHKGPCGADDFAWIDQVSMEPQKLHFRDGLTKPQLEHTLTIWMFDRLRHPPTEHQIRPPTCMSLPSNQQGNPWWWHALPCKPDDIGLVDSPGHIQFRQGVTTAQLRYAITLALDTFSGQPLDLSEYPFYKPSAHE